MLTKLFVVFSVLNFIHFTNNTSSLDLKITGIQSNKGKILVGIYKDNNTFPTMGKQYKYYFIDVKDKKASIQIPNLEKGTYAIAVIHDLNSNNKLDKNLVGMPLEPYGFSNNARGKLSAPSFKEASFYFDGNTSLVIKVQ